jgi:Tfp pilus assembly protein PilP
MNLSVIFKDPKLRMILLIIGSVILFVGIGYYYYANYVLSPISEEPIKPKTSVIPAPSFTDTISQILSTLTFREIIYTYPNIALGRSNPFVPVLQLSQERQVVSVTSQETSKIKPKVEVSTPIQVSSKEKSFISGLKVTGIIKYGNISYAIIEEGDKGYIVREGQKIKDDIYIFKIDEKSVSLKKGKEIATLRLGGE